MAPPNPKTISSPFVFLPYTSSPPPKPSFQVLNSSTWTYCGPLLPLDSKALTPSFQSWTNATFKPPTELTAALIPFLAYINDFLKKAGLSNYWITVRATLPTNEFDVPRWHTDDLFFEAPAPTSSTIPAPAKPSRRRLSKASSRNPTPKAPPKAVDTAGTPGTWKICTTLLGPSTLFLSPRNNDYGLWVQRTAKREFSSKYAHSCTSTRCLGCAPAADSVRQSLAVTFSGREFKVVNAALGECCWFRLGAVEGAVHSEPKCTVGEGEEAYEQGRVFVNVVPGTEEQLRGLMRRWGMEFPRAWCVGSAGGLCIAAIDENL